jgi:hypothetical protein
MLVVNSIRYSYQMADPSGLPRRLSLPLFDAKARAARAVVNRLGLDEVESDQMADQAFSFESRPDMNIGEVWFGPLGLVFIGVIIAETVLILRRRSLLRSGLVLMAWSYLPVLSLLTAWSFHKGRYTILLMAVAAPLIAGLHLSKGWLRLLTWTLGGLASVVLAWTLIYSDCRPLAGKSTVWEMDTITLETKAVPETGDMIRLVDREVPQDAMLGLWFQRRDWDYPLFGDDFSRTLVQIYPYPETLDRAWLAQQAFRFIIANTSLLPSPLPAELTVVGETRLYTLLRYDPAP